MFRYQQSRRVLGICTLLIVPVCTTCVGQTSQNGSIPLTPNQKQWTNLLEPWLDAVDKRYAAAEAARARVAARIAASVNDEKIESYCEQALSADSKLRRFRDHAKWRFWLNARFIEAICPLEEIDKSVKEELRRLERELDAIDADFLVTHDLDIEVSRAYGLQIHPLNGVRYDRVNKRIEKALDRIIPHLDRANQASVVKFGVETATGIAAERAVRLASSDDEGNISNEAAVLALGLGLMADAASQQVLDDLDETPLRLNEALRLEVVRLRREITDLVIAPETIAEDAELKWHSHVGRHTYDTPAEGEFKVAVYRHNYMVRHAIADHLEIDRTWTGEVTEAAYWKRRAK